MALSFVQIHAMMLIFEGRRLWQIAKPEFGRIGIKGKTEKKMKNRNKTRFKKLSDVDSSCQRIKGDVLWDVQ